MQANSNVIVQLFPLLFIFGIFYFLIIRPQMKKQKEHAAMINELKKNDEVVTSGGIHGTIINIKEKTFVVRVDENAKIEVDKTSVSYVKKQRT